MENIEVIIGLEIHAQLSTKTKLFCNCDNDSFGKEANTNVCPICMGFPGMLPVTNEEAINKALKISTALSCKVSPHSKFDRKNYFYPDLPSGYQISQFDEPIGLGGKLDISTSEGKKNIRITRVHIENDAGKLSHEGSSTLLDFNRSGTPLVEIVSEPDIRNAKEARAYAEMMQKVLRYSGASDADMEKGMMRFDASVSIRKMGDSKLNPRAEIKNLNSFKSLEAAIEYEIERQKEMWNGEKSIESDQTVGWDDERATTKILREKESAADYRYFAEPDLPPTDLSNEEIANVSAAELPLEKQERFVRDYKIQETDAIFYSENLKLADYFEEAAKKSGNPALANSFVSTVLVSKMKEMGLNLDSCKVSASQMAELIKLIDKGIISNNVAKSTVLDEMLNSGKNPEDVVKEKNLVQLSDSSEIEKLCKDAIAANPKAAEDVKAGQGKAIGALVGAVIKASGGKANPQLVNDTFKKLLV
jgi:aspartyl-tRNA(Asn)/glutamyl-tRNA(Gln) amidotransferase subunit B